MTARIAGVLALGLLAVADAPLHAQFRERGRRDGPASGYGWLSSLEAGKARARSTGKPLLVVLRCVP
jgi:hypothetical protein